MDKIKYEKFTLSNGLDVILHQDHALPLVAVNVWYHVGSKDEEPGKTGFAHLFEHVMFEGSKHHNRSHFEPLVQVGAALNGSTNGDRTNYWENLPSNYLELALWLESDRMGFLLDALDQRRLDIQRDVVKNERRQSYENRPYGMAGLRLQQEVYPPPHPYHWPTIGFHEDLDAADLKDVRAFFQRFYTPSNASLAIAGDIDIPQARDLVERYFGNLLPGDPITRARRTDSPLQGHAKLTMFDRVSLPRLYLVWPTVPMFHPDEAPLSVLASILGDGKSSRMYRAMVYEAAIAQSLSADHGAEEISGDFDIEVTAAGGRTLDEIEDAVRFQILRLQKEMPTTEEVARARNRIEWQHIRQMAGIGGFGGRADSLNAYNVMAGDVELVNRDLERYLAVQPEDIYRVAREYLGDRHVQLEVMPEPHRTYSGLVLDRTIPPGPMPARKFLPPEPRTHQLSNGLNIVVVEKRAVPAVSFGLVIDTGAVHDTLGLPGLAAFTTAMLQEGTATRTSIQVADELEFIGSHLISATSREGTVLAVETLSRHWPDALRLVTDLIRNPTFPEGELERVRKERLTALGRLPDDPTATAERLIPILVYGLEHPYGHPQMGTKTSLEDMTRGDMISHLRQHFRPEKATLVVVGDVAMEDVVALATELLQSWSAIPDGEASMDAKLSDGPQSPSLMLLDKPGAAQSVIRVGFLGVPRYHPDYFALVVANYILGGQFTARLNMNLRQDKGFSYGYRSSIDWHRNSSLFVIGGSVHTAVTLEAVKETLKELSDMKVERPVTEEEFETAKASLLRQFPSGFETSGQVLDQMIGLVSLKLPHTYLMTLADEIQAVTLADVHRVAWQYIETNKLVLLVVGDRNSVESGLMEMGLPITLVDHEGRAVN